VAVAAFVVGRPPTLLAAVFALAVAAHCVMDVAGGGAETRPWEATSERGVYNHRTNCWIRPRRWVRYAGAPEDLLLALLASLVPLIASDGWLRQALLGVLLCSALFAAVRRRLSPLVERLFAPDS